MIWRTFLVTWFAIVVTFPVAVYGELYRTKYYDLHTDLSPERVQEAVQRMTLMFEEYSRRTKPNLGKGVRRLPFYLFSNEEDYYRNGGMPGSAGVFDGSRLMAIANEEYGDIVWRIVQHEGFHQFVVQVIGGNIPIWVNEGLAEYFGEALFTGDSYVAGYVSTERATRIKALIEAGETKTIPEMMSLPHWQWNMEMNVANYDMAWSMVFFLGHAKDGRYQLPFQRFLDEVSKGKSWEQAWLRHFGAGTEEFERQWREYWVTLPANPTPKPHARAVTAALTSFLARAVSQNQSFDSVEVFFQIARNGELQAHEEQVLPASLLQWALDNVSDAGDWSFGDGKGRMVTLICTMKDNTKVVGSFTLRGGKVDRVRATIPGEDGRSANRRKTSPKRDRTRPERKRIDRRRSRTHP